MCSKREHIFKCALNLNALMIVVMVGHWKEEDVGRVQSFQTTCLQVHCHIICRMLSHTCVRGWFIEAWEENLEADLYPRRPSV